MILLLFIIIAVVLTVIAVIFKDDYGFKEVIGGVSIAIGAIAWFAVAFMIVTVICNNIGIDGKIAVSQQTYDSLVYQLDNNLYDNDNDIGKKELYNEVTNWNTDIARGKALQHNFWVGIFYPDIYDEFDYISLPK